MHMEESTTQVILGTPFLAATGALIDVLKGIITLRVSEAKVTIYALSYTNPSPLYPIAKNPRAPNLGIIPLKSTHLNLIHFLIKNIMSHGNHSTRK